MSLTLLSLPVIEARYTQMLLDVLTPHVDRVLPQDPVRQTIREGEFLDVTATVAFQSQQLAEVAGLFGRAEVKDGDSFLLADVWGPAAAAIRQMAQQTGKRVRIVALNHAGRADPTDFVRLLGKWSDSWERGQIEACDGLIVGSHFHADQVRAHFPGAPQISVTGMPWDPDWVTSRAERFPVQSGRVIWPHRPSSEKGVIPLAHFVELYGGEVLITSSGPSRWPNFPIEVRSSSRVTYRYGLSKAEYYVLMGSSEVYLSTAYQETFGYTLHEALALGVAPLCPRRACYPESLPEGNLYGRVEEAVEKVTAGSLPTFLPHEPNAERICAIARGTT